LAFLVRNDVLVVPSQLQMYPNGVLECQRLCLKLERSNLDMFHIYNPNQIVSLPEWNFYMQQMSNNAIFLGDFNAHHPLWTHRVRRGCTTARNLVSALLQHPLQLATPHSLPTYLDPRSGRTSTIDLIYLSPHLYPAATVQLGPDLGSDHCPVQLSR
jgi:endonuclease/exonuclease/phosphatase family metal-dependent hydrolase